jgi:transcriptional regulator of arginine metabolism
MAAQDDTIQKIREILESRPKGTQQQFRRLLKKQGIDITQSTISRAFSKLNAIKEYDENGNIFYRLPTIQDTGLMGSSTIGDFIQEVAKSESMIVIRTTPGAAHITARLLDEEQFPEIMGTIAGDDTIFISPRSNKLINQLHKSLSHLISNQ